MSAKLGHHIVPSTNRQWVARRSRMMQSTKKADMNKAVDDLPSADSFGHGHSLSVYLSIYICIYVYIYILIAYQYSGGRRHRRPLQPSHHGKCHACMHACMHVCIRLMCRACM